MYIVHIVCVVNVIVMCVRDIVSVNRIMQSGMLDMYLWKGNGHMCSVYGSYRYDNGNMCSLMWY